MPELYKYVTGWFTYRSLYEKLINDLYTKLPEQPSNFIEIGCWFGQSATYMTERLKELESNTHAFFLDTWLGGKGESEETLVQEKGVDHVYNEFRKNIDSTGYKNVHIIRDDSVKGAENFPDDFFDLVFIDAGHRGWQCYNDMVAWYPKLRKDGVMAGHDIDFIDVEKSVDRFTSEYNIPINRIGSPTQCWVFIK